MDWQASRTLSHAANFLLSLQADKKYREEIGVWQVCEGEVEILLGM